MNYQQKRKSSTGILNFIPQRETVLGFSNKYLPIPNHLISVVQGKHLLYSGTVEFFQTVGNPPNRKEETGNAEVERPENSGAGSYNVDAGGLFLWLRDGQQAGQGEMPEVWISLHGR
jgi:hypothetical protein